ncbi:MAG: MlaD family protein [Kiritimatiellae bacterium]|nr:MlaD family protein [Kiritimatiellia bacterium]
MQKCKGRTQLFVELFVGVVIICLLVGLGYFTIVLSNDALFAKKQVIKVEFDNVMGLSEGDNVVVRGMPVGKVDVLVLEPQKGITVTCKLNQPINVYKGYKISVVTTSVLGGRYLEIEPGVNTDPEIQLDKPLVGEQPVNMMSDLTDVIAKLKKALFEEGIVDNIVGITDDLKKITGDLEQGKGSIGMLLTDNGSLYNNLSLSIDSFAVISKRLENGEGTMGKLLSTDSQMYEDLAATIASIKTISTRLENGEGTLGKLLSPDSSMYDDLTDTMANINVITGQIANGKGTIGRLVMDEGMYIELQSVVSDAHSALDDWRELSPISTFSSVFFGAF